jgi:hypothetical protein
MLMDSIRCTLIRRFQPHTVGHEETQDVEKTNEKLESHYRGYRMFSNTVAHYLCVTDEIHDVSNIHSGKKIFV